MNYQDQIRQRITDQIIAALRAGTRPWVRPWVDSENSGFPTNVISGNRYSGCNVLLLQMRGYHSKFWATFRQWQSIGGEIKKRPDDVPPGQWGTKIIWCKQVAKTRKTVTGDEKEERFFAMREFVVFNAEQVTGPGIEKYHARPQGQSAFVDYQPAEMVIAATGADIRYGGNRAFYSPDGDFIQMPPRESFVNAQEWYQTHFHELCHFTEHESRLNWQSSYALGELRAEVGGCFLATELGIPNSDDLSNHHAYLAAWLQELENDPKAIFQAATAASKAADFILSFSRGRNEKAEEEVGASG